MSKGAVFVTGSSSGIGKAAVERLAADGYDVIAGVRREGDAPAAAQHAVTLDISDAASIEPAAALVVGHAARSGRLAAVVNNAGVNVNGPSAVLPIDEWRRQFEVNFFGHVAVTRALLPALLETRGRVVTVGSVGGRLAVPFLGPYSASKFAVRAWMDALRLELAPHGVRVVLVEPGAIATPIWSKGNAAADEMVGALSDEQRRRYGSQIERGRATAGFAERHAISPDRVARVISRGRRHSSPSSPPGCSTVSSVCSSASPARRDHCGADVQPWRRPRGAPSRPCGSNEPFDVNASKPGRHSPPTRSAAGALQARPRLAQ
jgi:NAD(P)-dependent dehydrogenase (short-subunit alcohol dehydrogenase family)